MTWLTARIAESSAYLLFEPQPAMNRPTISIEETARKNSTPMFRSATPSPGANGIVAKMSMQGTQEDDRRQVVDRCVGRRRHDVFLHHQLHRVGDRLEQAVRADAVRTDARLHPRGELALEQRDVGDDADDDVQDDHRRARA